MQAGLRLDDADDSTHINLQSKTVSTPAGDLPASPLFDPEWVKTRRRATKADRGMPSGRFRKKLSNNPYGKLARLVLLYNNLTNRCSSRSSFAHSQMRQHVDVATTILSTRL